MTANNTSSVFLRGVLVLSLAAGLGACGGDEIFPTSQDTTPSEFNLVTANQYEAEPATLYVSEVITVVGIDRHISGDEANTASDSENYLYVPISVEGMEYSINGGDFTSAQGQVKHGDQVQVRQTSADDFSTPQKGFLTIGSRTKAFVLNTRDRDNRPIDFEIEPVVQAPTSSWVASAPFVVDGFDPLPIRVESGEYSLNGGEFIATEGVVSLGDTVIVRLLSAETQETDSTATLFIGDYDYQYKVSTFKPDTEAPVVTLVFPPKSAMTKGNSIQVLGTVSDDLSDIKSVTVTLKDAAISGDQGTSYSATLSNTGSVIEWETAPINLPEDKTYLIEVTAEDDFGDALGLPNNISAAMTASLTRDSVGGSFPAGQADETKLAFVSQMAYDAGAEDDPATTDIDETRKPRLLVTDRNTPERVVAVDLETGRRSLFVNMASTNVLGIAIDQDSVYVAMRGENSDRGIYQYPVTLTNTDSAGFRWVHRGTKNQFYNELLIDNYTLPETGQRFRHMYFANNLGTGDILFREPLERDINWDGNFDGDERYNYHKTFLDMNSMAIVPAVDGGRERRLFLTTNTALAMPSSQQAGPNLFTLPADEREKAGEDVIKAWDDASKPDNQQFAALGINNSGAPASLAYDNYRDADRLLVQVENEDDAPDTIIALEVDDNDPNQLTPSTLGDPAGDNPVMNSDALLTVSGFGYAFISELGANRSTGTPGVGEDGILAVDLKYGQRVYITKN